MNKEEIEAILSVSEASCISVIVPTHRLTEEKKNNYLTVNNAIGRMKELLAPDVRLLSKVDNLCKKIRFSHTKDGIGIFVSPGIAKLVYFPFPVKERIAMGNRFNSRELVYYKNISDYFMLSVSKKKIRLYRGNGEEMNEIVNDVFPLIYTEACEYEKPSLPELGSVIPKAFEKDKSILQELRFIDFLRTADRELENYIAGNSPLVLSGSGREVADYRNITRYGHRIIGKVIGAHTYNKKQSAHMIWSFVKNYTTIQNNLLVLKLRELINRQTAVFGLENVESIAAEGKGLILLVEKDFEDEIPAGEKSSCSLTDDRINKVIRTIMEKKGRIIFVDKGTLKDFSGIALILRYTNY